MVKIKEVRGKMGVWVEGGYYRANIRPSSGYRWFIHEMGHVLVRVLKLKRCQRFRQVFGRKEKVNYQKWWWTYRMAEYALGNIVRIKGQPSLYSCLNGEEDFCECLSKLIVSGFEAGEDEELNKKMEAVLSLLERNPLSNR